MERGPAVFWSAWSFVPQNPIHRGLQIFGNQVRLPGPGLRVPGKIAEAVASFHENSFCTCVEGEFHVAVAIADNERALQVEAKSPRRAMQHAWIRLAAVAVVRLIVRATINRSGRRAAWREIPFHLIVKVLR